MLATGRSLTELVQTMEANHIIRGERAGHGTFLRWTRWSQCQTACSGLVAEYSDRSSVHLSQGG